ncbi:MurR/RpiR family transcriptional regulator [Paenibacillus sp. Marseille-Q4541]|uniref:MurR/RpiR family transcriptional regulator n=1 Tax=Paenibacillus sp. Marseille-Q4541 TaxID=2831522 RepID=UPI001BAD466F|nr:MurR/RpiR family transcriptional regulator [Paenibacillus sp. Marseille-Q4541]
MYDSWNKKSFSTNQRLIADFIQRNEQRVLYLTEQEIADELDISIASVSRFWRAVGYVNAKQFKAKLRFRLESTPAIKLQETINQVGDLSLPETLLATCMQHLEETCKRLTPSLLSDASLMIRQARHVYIFSPGPCISLADLFAFRLKRFGIEIRIMAASGHELLESLMHTNQEDVILIFGFVHLLPEIEVIMDHAREAHYRVILMTDRFIYPRSDHADIVLYAGRGEVWEFHSMVGPIYVIENLILNIGLSMPEQSLAKLTHLQQMRVTYSTKLPR